MKDFCNKVLQNRQVSENQLFEFIAEYLELQGKTFEAKDISAIFQCIQMRMFDLNHAIKQYCILKGYQMYTLSIDRKIIKSWVE